MLFFFSQQLLDWPHVWIEVPGSVKIALWQCWLNQYKNQAQLLMEIWFSVTCLRGYKYFKFLCAGFFGSNPEKTDEHKLWHVTLSSVITNLYFPAHCQSSYKCWLCQMLTLLTFCACMWYIHMHACDMNIHICMHNLHVNSKYPRELSNHFCEKFLGNEPFPQLQRAESRALWEETGTAQMWIAIKLAQNLCRSVWQDLHNLGLSQGMPGLMNTAQT